MIIYFAFQFYCDLIYLHGAFVTSCYMKTWQLPLQSWCSRCWRTKTIRRRPQQSLLCRHTCMFPSPAVCLTQLTSPPSGQSAPLFILCPEGMMHPPKDYKTLFKIICFYIKDTISNSAGPNKTVVLIADTLFINLYIGLLMSNNTFYLFLPL